MSQFHNNHFAVGWLVERLGLNAVSRRRKQWSHFSSSPRGALSAGAVVAGACQIPILSHAETMTPSDAFVDDSMDRQDALAASPRFTVQRTPEGIRVQLQEGDTDPGTGLTIDRALALLENLLEQGRAVTIHD